MSLLGAILLSGCGPKFLDGYVVTKEFRPAHETRQLYYIKVGNVNTPHWSTVNHPDRWYITIAKEKFGNEMETVEVTRETYEAAKRGEKVFLE